MPKTYYVYIMASQRNGTLYIGMTNNLDRRAWEHREGRVPGFTEKYGIKTLVYFETCDDVRMAIHRETRLKKFTRCRKLELIESANPQWRDLTESHAFALDGPGEPGHDNLDYEFK